MRQESGMGQLIEQDRWAESPGRWHGELEGAAHGNRLSLIFFSSDKVGGGPRLHRHPYPETFIVRTGRALFTLGDQQIVAEAGHILVAPANMPHKFSNLGPGLLEQIDIHASETFITEWLE
jgi:mannose-6-phosphate isomerase-like protein (cupin superfamily)